MSNIRYIVLMTFGLVLTIGAASAQTARAAAAAICPRPAAGASVMPPPDLFSDHSGTLRTTMDYRTDLDDSSRTLFCLQASGNSESPTLHVRPGDQLDLTVHNSVPALPRGSPTEIISNQSNVCGSAVMTETSMNIHFHGMNVSPLCGGDDVVHTLVNSGKTFHYHINVPNDEPPGLYWYHPHVHGIAEPALQGGASGVIVVEGIESLQPSVAGLPERILVIRDQVVAGGPAPGGVVPSWDISVNYVPISYPAMVPSVIRAAGHGKEFWRVANASADTVLDLQLTYDGIVQTLQVVGLDGVPTNSQDGDRSGRLVPVSHILIPTAGRAEFIIPAPPPGTRHAVLQTLNIDTGPLGDNDPTRTLAKISFNDRAAPDLRLMPSADGAGVAHVQRFEGVDTAPVTAHRKLYFSEVVSDPSDPASPTNFYITVDGQKPVLFDPVNPPAITTHLGAVEDWTIENRAGEVHEFHMHQVHFKLLARDHVPVGRAESQFLDMVQVPYWSGTGPYPSVTVRMDFRGMVVGDYVYHCHILGHEDNGMMAIIRVLPPA